MNLKDFVRDKYKEAWNIIQLRKQDPLAFVMASDIFTYDVIAHDESGRLVKMLIYNDKGDLIPVHELLSFSSIDEVPDDLKVLYENYTSKYKFSKVW